MPNPTPGTQGKPGQPSKPTAPQNKPDLNVKPGGKPLPEAVRLEETVDWSKFGKATVDTGIAVGDRVDVEKEVPQAIRDDVEFSLGQYLEKLKGTKEGDRVEPVWMIKELASEDLAKTFTRLAKRYGQYRADGQLTVRGGPLNKDPKTVRFCAKPYEKRGPRKSDATVTDKK